MEAHPEISSNYLWISRSQEWKRYNRLHTNVGNPSRHGLWPHERVTKRETKNLLLPYQPKLPFNSFFDGTLYSFDEVCSETNYAFPLLPSRIRPVTESSLYLIELRCLFWSLLISSELKTSSVLEKCLKLFKFYERVLYDKANSVCLKICLGVWGQNKAAKLGES